MRSFEYRQLNTHFGTGRAYLNCEQVTEKGIVQARRWTLQQQTSVPDSTFFEMIATMLHSAFLHTRFDEDLSKEMLAISYKLLTKSETLAAQEQSSVPSLDECGYPSPADLGYNDDEEYVGHAELTMSPENKPPHT